eukprot:4869823-Ditylum_brightwellii.AAC.1
MSKVSISSHHSGKEHLGSQHTCNGASGRYAHPISLTQQPTHNCHSSPLKNWKECTQLVREEQKRELDPHHNTMRTGETTQAWKMSRLACFRLPLPSSKALCLHTLYPTENQKHPPPEQPIHAASHRVCQGQHHG